MAEPRRSTGPQPVPDAGGGFLPPDVVTDALAGAEEPDEPQDEVATYTPDIAALQRAGGATHVWAHEFYELVGHITGKWVSEETFEEWLGVYASQIKQAAYREAMFQVANTTLPPAPAGDAGLLLLTLRNDLAQGLRHSAGL